MNHIRRNFFRYSTVVIADQVLIAVWYSPFLFGDRWLNLIGSADGDLTLAKGTPYLFSILGSVVINIFMSKLFQALDARSTSKRLFYATAIWAGLIFPFMTLFYKFAGTSYGVLAIDLGLTYVWLAAAAIFLQLPKRSYS